MRPLSDSVYVGMSIPSVSTIGGIWAVSSSQAYAAARMVFGLVSSYSRDDKYG